MSALGQKQTFRSAIAMSALPPKANIRHVAACAELERIATPARDKLGPSFDSVPLSLNYRPACSLVITSMTLRLAGSTIRTLSSRSLTNLKSFSTPT
jgi:hypothetical protein